MPVVDWNASSKEVKNATSEFSCIAQRKAMLAFLNTKERGEHYNIIPF